jgi:hypothetical protein
MDSLTHVYFAWRLAEVSATDPASAYASLFPQIDRNPPYFHRLYAHNFGLARDLSKIGQEVMSTGRIPTKFKDNYVWKRFLEERPRILSYRQKFSKASGVSLPAPGTDALSGAIAYLSHIYFDTYNNPVQAFLPEIVHSCAQVELWQSLNPVAFRLSLYQSDNLEAFRKRLYFSNLWDARLEPHALAYALVEQTAASCFVKVSRLLVKKTNDGLGIGGRPDAADLHEAQEFMREAHALTTKLTLEYGRKKPRLKRADRPPLPV